MNEKKSKFNKKAVLTIAGACVCGIIAVLLVSQYLKRKEAEINKGMTKKAVIVLSTNVKAGTRLQKGMITKRGIPETYIHGNSIKPAQADLLYGMVFNYPLKRGDMLLWSDLREFETKSGRHSGLAGKITKGERALTIGVGTLSGVGGYLVPNDHVDILCTVRSSTTGEETTITLLQNVTIIATGEYMTGSTPENHGDYGNITLLVSLDEAELLVFAQTKGELIAALRNPEDIETHTEIPSVDFSNVMEKEFRKDIQDKRDKINVIKRGVQANKKKGR